MNILICELGGTIASHMSQEGTVVLGNRENKSFGQIYAEKIFEGDKLTFIRPVYYSSECATVSDYRTAIRALYEGLSSGIYDAALVLHGTDTMAFFVQLCARCLASFDVPVAVTGSKLPPEDEDSDAEDNLLECARLIGRGRKGVFCVYNNGDRSFPVDGFDIMSPDINGNYGCYEYDSSSARSMNREERVGNFLESDSLREVIYIPAVPDQAFLVTATLKEIHGRSKCGTELPGAAVIECYHSGTCDTRLEELVALFVAHGIKVYLAGFPEGGNVYESRSEMIEAGAVPMNGMPPEGVWAEAVLG